MKKSKTASVLHGNKAKFTTQNVEPVYQTLTITPKNTTGTKVNTSVATVSDENVILAKEFVDENHK